MKKKTTRQVDPQGRVSIPGYIRELAGINAGDTVTVEVGEDNVLRIYANSDRCCICGENHEKMLSVLIGPNKHLFCLRCAQAIANRTPKMRGGKP